MTAIWKMLVPSIFQILVLHIATITNTDLFSGVICLGVQSVIEAQQIETTTSCDDTFETSAKGSETTKAFDDTVLETFTEGKMTTEPTQTKHVPTESDRLQVVSTVSLVVMAASLVFLVPLVLLLLLLLYRRLSPDHHMGMIENVTNTEAQLEQHPAASTDTGIESQQPSINKTRNSQSRNRSVDTLDTLDSLNYYSEDYISRDTLNYS